MEILHEVPVQRWPELQRKLKKQWPQNMGGYYALKINITCPAIRDLIQFKVYCPHGDTDNGVVLIRKYNMQSDGEKVINIFLTSEVTSKLEEAVRNTKLINWEQNVTFDFVPTNLLHILQNTDQLKKCEIESHLLSLYYKDPSTEKLELSLPSGTYVSSIKDEHIKRINDVWGHKFTGSDKMFATLASNALSYGLYSEDNDRLLAWLFIGDYGHLCHLYCEETDRRQGYGNFLLEYVTNELMSRGDDTFGFVLHGNTKSISLFTKLGFQFGGDCVYYKTKYIK